MVCKRVEGEEQCDCGNCVEELFTCVNELREKVKTQSKKIIDLDNRLQQHRNYNNKQYRWDSDYLPYGEDDR